MKLSNLIFENNIRKSGIKDLFSICLNLDNFAKGTVTDGLEVGTGGLMAVEAGIY